VVTQKSLDRRAKVLDQSNLIGVMDLPVNQGYIDQLVQIGFIVKHKSKWFNAISGYANQNLINQIAQIQFVKQLDVVGTYAVRKDDIEFEHMEPNNDNPLQPEGVHTFNYGNSFTQLNQINIPAVHDSGYNGTGVTICVMDAGFSNLTHEAFSSLNIAATYDFSTGSPNLTGHSHGTATLSLIGGFKQGQLIGPAFGATYLLARTEVDPTETPQEEDNWIAAMEWADSLGVDVTSTSLGYLDFDPPFTSYTWQDMDGNTARITIAADYAVSLGITVVNSAGNSGYDPSHNTLGAPADGDSVITIGAVTSSGSRASFSSVGPTVDGRIKPDLMAMGSNNYYASTFGNQYGNGSGTSFSCPLVAGVCALIIQKNPSLTPMEVLQLLRSTATRSINPDNLFGWGIINALNAINLITVPVELTLFNAVYAGGVVNLGWITATELNNFGFEVERRDDNSSFEMIGFVSGTGTSTNRITYNYIDENLSSNRYYYRLKQIDFDGTFDYSQEVLVDIQQLSDFKLFQNYPNPFNPSTNIRYYVSKPGYIKIGLYDLIGNEIKTLMSKEVQSGTYEINVDGSNLASGMYFVKVIAQGNQQVIKISLIK
ncbi:MAG: S8/S53 family peptidase, partial [Ignavibacteria bacterium]|nr:S8/S53 family peptidase [Ignavibacteria bacterium]